VPRELGQGDPAGSRGARSAPGTAPEQARERASAESFIPSLSSDRDRSCGKGTGRASSVVALLLPRPLLREVWLPLLHAGRHFVVPSSFPAPVVWMMILRNICRPRGYRIIYVTMAYIYCFSYIYIYIKGSGQISEKQKPDVRVRPNSGCDRWREL
jgi:hypothetical protein